MLEPLFGSFPGVVRSRVGYCGGSTDDPTYLNMGKHTETLELDFSPDVTSYSQLLERFFQAHEACRATPRPYRSVVFYRATQEQSLARRVRAKFQKRPITCIEPLEKTTFWLAEKTHQKFVLRSSPQVAVLQSFSSEAFIIEPIATALSALAGGCLTHSQFRALCTTIGIPERLESSISQLRLDPKTLRFVSKLDLTLCPPPKH